MGGKYLKRDEYLPYAPEHVGKVRVNHSSDDCSGSSNSMIVERKDDDTILAYCHRCGKSGRHINGYFKAPSDRKALRVPTAEDRCFDSAVKHYDDARLNWDDWTTEARGWLQSFGLSAREVVGNDIKFHRERQELMFPLYTHAPTMVGYTSRQFHPDWGGPKWMTVMKEGQCKYFIPTQPLIYTKERQRTLVLVEDPVSAIKVSRFLPCIALLGVNMPDCLLKELIGDFDKFIIFLDNDSNTVREKQRVLRNKLSIFGGAVIISGVGKDPKECTDDELRRILL